MKKDGRAPLWSPVHINVSEFVTPARVKGAIQLLRLYPRCLADFEPLPNLRTNARVEFCRTLAARLRPYFQKFLSDIRRAYDFGDIAADTLDYLTWRTAWCEEPEPRYCFKARNVLRDWLRV